MKLTKGFCVLFTIIYEFQVKKGRKGYLVCIAGDDKFLFSFNLSSSSALFSTFRMIFFMVVNVNWKNYGYGSLPC